MPLALILLIAVVGTFTILALSRPARAGAAAIVAQLGIWLIWAAQHAAPEIAAEITGTIAAALSTAKPSLTAMTTVLLREITGVDGLTIGSEVFRPGEFVEGSAIEAFDRAIKKISDTIAPREDLDPESGQRNMARLLGITLGAGMQLWFIAVLLDLLSLGKLRSSFAFHEAVIGGLGLQRMTRLAWRAPVNEAITKPMTTHYLRTFMATTPTPAEAVDGWQRGIYDDERVIDLLRNHGYSYQLAVELLNIREKRLTTAEGSDLLKAGKIDEETFRRIVKEQGYGETRTDLILAREQDAETKTLLRGIADTARRLFRAGDITEDELRQYLGEARFTDPEIRLVLAAEQLALREEKALPVATLLEAFQEGALDPEQLRARLRQQHYTDADIDILLTTRTKKLTVAQITEAFARARLTRPEAEDRLRRLGYSAADIPTLLDLRVRDLTEGQILDALTHNLINVQTAREKLERLGFAVDAIDVLLAFQRKTLAPAEVQAALLRGLLSVEVATRRLVEAGYSRADADLLIELRFRLLTVGQTLDAYGEDFITRPEALGDLMGHGFSSEDAQLLVSKFDARQAAAAARRGAAGTSRIRRPPPPPAPTA